MEMAGDGTSLSIYYCEGRSRDRCASGYTSSLSLMSRLCSSMILKMTNLDTAFVSIVTEDDYVRRIHALWQRDIARVTT